MSTNWWARALFTRDPSGGSGSLRRAPFVIAASVAGLAAVLNYRTPTSSSTALRIAKPANQAPAPAAPRPSTSPSTATSPTKATTPTTAATPANGSAAGTLEQYGYGQLSVRVTVQNGRIVSLTTASLQTAESYSQQIAVQVIPMLRSEILKAQSTRVYGITGATYTSDAYASSVQSALDQLHFQ